MLEVQKFLQNQSLSDLESEFGISSNILGNRVILNYDQIESHSHRFHPIVRECRGLVLNSNSYELVAKSFNRFFNLGEHREEQDQFDWNSCVATDKEDGSLIIVYKHGGNWCVNTRNSYGDGKVNASPYSWRDLFGMAYPNWEQYLDPALTYTFELCSRYNKIVRDYPFPCVRLLTAFTGPYEFFHDNLLEVAREARILPVKSYNLHAEDEVINFIKEMSANDATYEGVVLRDKNNVRIKVKSPEYIALHRLANNGNVASLESILHLILVGETEEVQQYFPELKPYFHKVEQWLCFHSKFVGEWWKIVSKIESQKDFALKVLSFGKDLAWIFFEARRLNINPCDILNSVNYEDKIYKLMKREFGHHFEIVGEL